MSDDTVRLSLEDVRNLAEHVCRAAGYSPSHAQAIARTVTAAERDEARSHGLFRIPFYVKALTEGGVSPDTEPEVSQPAPAVRVLEQVQNSGRQRPGVPGGNLHARAADDLG